jgi:5-methyltetrahydropteroyltriglutamate--homocysteine methyltransferase
MILDMARAVHQEAVELDRAGAQYIQIDEPALSTRLGDLDLAIEAMGIVTDRLRAKTITHMCYGDFASVYPRFLDLPVQQFDMEMANSGYDLVDLFKTRGLPDDREIAWGVIDVHTHVVESVEQVVAGIRKGLEVLPPERLYIDPDCGLKTRTPQEAEAKLRVMMEGVHLVRKDLGLEQ